MFRLLETRGVPLEIIVDELEKSNYIVDWIDFYESSLKCGWNISTTLNKIECCLTDIKGKQYCDDVLLRLKYYIVENNNDI